MARKQPGEKEILINKLVALIIKGKVKNFSKQSTLIKAKMFIRASGKSWTTGLSQLFESTWSKRISKDTKDAALEITDPPKAMSIKPNKVFTPKPVATTHHNKPEEDEDIDIDINITSPVVDNNLVKTKKREYNIERRRDPFDIDDPKYDTPIVSIKPTKRICSKCGDSFMRTNEYPNMLLCSKCNEWAKDIFSINNVYAADIQITSGVDLGTGIGTSVPSKHRILKAK